MSPAAPRAASVRSKLVVNTVLGVGFALASVPIITRLPLHEWLSLAWVVVLFLHIVFAWGWVVNVSKRAVQSVRSFRAMRWQVQVNFLWDVTLYVTTALSMVSGVLVSMFALPYLGIDMGHDRFWAILHTSSSDALILMVGVHLALHWPWLKSTTVRLFTGSLAGAPRRPDGWTWWMGPMATVVAVSMVASLLTWGLGATPIATMMRGPTRQPAPIARVSPPAVPSPAVPSTPSTSPTPQAAASPGVAVTGTPRTPASAGAAGRPAGATTAPATPRPRRTKTFPERVLVALGFLGRWMGIPFVVTMILLSVIERRRRASRGGRTTVALDAAG